MRTRRFRAFAVKVKSSAICIGGDHCTGSVTNCKFLCQRWCPLTLLFLASLVLYPSTCAPEEHAGASCLLQVSLFTSPLAAGSFPPTPSTLGSSVFHLSASFTSASHSPPHLVFPDPSQSLYFSGCLASNPTNSEGTAMCPER